MSRERRRETAALCNRLVLRSARPWSDDEDDDDPRGREEVQEESASVSVIGRKTRP